MSNARSRRLLDDTPVVREVRAIRKKLLAQADGSIEGYFRLMNDLAAKRREKIGMPKSSGKSGGVSKRARRKAA